MRTIKLTEPQYDLLIRVLGNGFGDGDFFGANDQEPYEWSSGNKRDVRVWNALVIALGVNTASCGVYPLDTSATKGTP